VGLTEPSRHWAPSGIGVLGVSHRCEALLWAPNSFGCCVCVASLWGPAPLITTDIGAIAHLSKLVAADSICMTASSPASNRTNAAHPLLPSGPTAPCPAAGWPTAIQLPSQLTAAHTLLLLLLAEPLFLLPGVPPPPPPVLLPAGVVAARGGGLCNALTGRQPWCTA
jgi:hypothetical protein